MTPGVATTDNALAPLGVELGELPIARERLLRARIGGRE